MSEARAQLYEQAAERGRQRSLDLTARERFIWGSYDAAQTTIANERHWAAADALSADKANSLAVRKTLRERARYEAANNTYAQGMVLTLANHVVGRCPRLQIRTGNPKRDAEIEGHWKAWAREIRLGAKLRTMRWSRAIDGEAFARQITNTQLLSPVKLDLELIECDRVTSTSLTGEDKTVDGITFDEFGNPESYRILKSHPGGSAMSTGQDADKVKAKLVYHWFRADRPGQHRGVPDIMSALPLFAMLRRYTLAVLDAAETAADFAIVLHTDLPASGEAQEIEPMDAIELERNMMTTMPGGWKPTQMRAEQPATTYPDFKHEILNEIARCLNMPFNIAACNSSSYNYASGRLDHQTYFTGISIDQEDLTVAILDPLTAAWLEEAKHALNWPEDVPAGMREYMFDGREHVDPVKESKSRDMDLANASTTLADECAKQGKDWEEQLQQAAKEYAMRRELGLPIPGQKNAAATVAEAAAEAAAEALEEAQSDGNR